MNIFDDKYEVTTEMVCQRSATDHKKLILDARTDRLRKGFNVDESYVLCTGCRMKLSLKK